MLNSGYGWLSRQYGLGSDNLLNVRLVSFPPTDTGTIVPTIVDANRDQRSDLFWAMKGAGGSGFGIVTEMTYQVYPNYVDGNYVALLFVDLVDVPQFLVTMAEMDKNGTLPRQFRR